MTANRSQLTHTRRHRKLGELLCWCSPQETEANVPMMCNLHKRLKANKQINESLARNSTGFMEMWLVIATGLHSISFKALQRWNGFRDSVTIELTLQVDVTILGKFHKENAWRMKRENWKWISQRRWSKRIQIENTIYNTCANCDE